jgi:fatty-acyl-CoA synthase
LSQFVDAIIATAARSPQGMITGAPSATLQRSWAELHALARRLAAGLTSGSPGLQRGDAVAILAGEPAEVAPLAQAVWLAGGSVTMLHQPTPRTDLQVWVEDTLRVLRMIGAKLVVVGSPFEPITDVLAAQGIGYRMVGELENDGNFTVTETGADDIALLQLTSGSTAEPKAVQITHGNLYSNLVDSSNHLECDENHDVMVSWLPLFHDMGMVGTLLLPMLSGIGLVSFTPTEFLTRPLLWAELISEHGGTMTTAPNFAWSILARQLSRAPEGSLDLSRLKVACNGAEPIDPSTMDAFTREAARFKLRPEAVNCCYGAAEATLAISLSELRHTMMVDVVDALELEKNRRAVPATDGATRSFPLLGKPYPAIEIRVVNEDGEVLGEREVGSLQLRGAPVTAGYLTESGFVHAQDAEGWLDIGDEGYFADGQVVVCGRRKDVIIMAGRNLYPTDIERAAGSVPEVRQGNVVAVRLLAGEDGTARESFAVLAESRLAGDASAEEAMREAIFAKVVSEVDARPATVLILPPGSLPKTPSGKLRRDAARALLTR